MHRSRKARRQPTPKPTSGKPRTVRSVLWILPVAAGLVLAGFVVYGIRHGPAAPNVLLITLDTTRADYLGCYGRAHPRTPHMDRLAREGARFLRCSASVPLTLPSHASIMTATYPYVHGARRNATNRVAEGNVTLAEVLSNAGYTTRAVVAAMVLDHKFGLAQGFGAYRDVVAHTEGDPMEAQRPGDEVCNDAIEILRAAASQRFFLWVHFYDPHYPYVARRPGPASPAEAYEDEIAFVDAQIGRLMQELGNLGLEKRTLVVVVGDHGEGLDQHEEWQHGYFVYETTLHVPMIFWGPRWIPEARVIQAQVRTIDVAPTILALLSQPPLTAAQGVSLTPLLSGDAQDLELSAYSESLEAHSQLGLSPLRSWCVNGWKYILAAEPQLYHLVTDPAETKNQITEQPELAARMREQLRELIAEAPPPLSDQETAVSLSGADLARLRSLGYVGEGAGDTDQGETELDKFEPHGADPRTFTRTIRDYEEARQAIGHGQYPRAEEQLRKVVKALPDAALPLGDLAHALSQQGKLEEAIRLYQQALAQEPGAAHLHVTYGQVLLAAQKLDEAAAQFTAALTAMPDNVVVLQNLGIALSSLGRFDEARGYFERALEIEPENIRLLHGMGVFYVRQNKLAEAAEMFRRALRIDPNQPRVRDDLQRVLRAMGQ
jgi:arylsulfatase A-like enzyme/Tfp pilus assembly protein PilF